MLHSLPPIHEFKIVFPYPSVSLDITTVIDRVRELTSH